jgi:hypothetical protein
MDRALVALVLFGISFGYVEASVVIYLRALYEPLRQNIRARPPDELFPLITLDQLQSAGPQHSRRLAIELGREAATLVMLASVALAVAANVRQWVAAFLIAFGVWDIAFYAFLKLLIAWPASLLTWDLLFLLPVPWVGPVLAPVLVSLSMIVCGWIAFRRPIHLRRAHWLAIIAGGGVIVLSFIWDYRNSVTGGMPNPFAWGIFAMGELIGLGGFLAAAAHPKSRVFQIPLDC